MGHELVDVVCRGLDTELDGLKGWWGSIGGREVPSKVRGLRNFNLGLTLGKHDVHKIHDDAYHNANHKTKCPVHVLYFM